MPRLHIGCNRSAHDVNDMVPDGHRRHDKCVYVASPSLTDCPCGTGMTTGTTRSGRPSRQARTLVANLVAIAVAIVLAFASVANRPFWQPMRSQAIAIELQLNSVQQSLQLKSTFLLAIDCKLMVTIEVQRLGICNGCTSLVAGRLRAI